MLNETAISKKNLSKHKTLYRVYCADDGKLHMESFPVVYINDSVLYYIRPDGRRLVETPLWCVHEEFPEKLLLEKLQTSSDKSYALFWTPVSRERLNELEMSFRRMALKGKLSDTLEKIEQAEYDLKCLQTQIRRYKEECERLRTVWDRESMLWGEIQRNRIARLNQMVEAGVVIQSKYVRNEKELDRRAKEYDYSDGYSLEGWSYRTATILQSFLGCADEDEIMMCRIRFGDEHSKAIFDVFADELPDLLDYFRPCKDQISL